MGITKFLLSDTSDSESLHLKGQSFHNFWSLTVTYECERLMMQVVPSEGRRVEMWIEKNLFVKDRDILETHKMITGL